MGVALIAFGMTVGGGESPATAGGPPRLVTRCYARDIPVPKTFEPFEASVMDWMATCVAAHRERQLVSGNASVRAVWGNVQHLHAAGASARLDADFGWKSLGDGAYGVDSVRFTTPVKAPPPPAAPPSTSTPAPLLDVKEKLPASLNDELVTALKKVRKMIDDDQHAASPHLKAAQAARMRCRIDKLGDSKADDRVVSWIGICAGGVSGGGNTTGCGDKIEAKLKDAIKRKEDLDQDRWFTHHMRTIIVNAGRRLDAGPSSADALGFLAEKDVDIIETPHGLEKIRVRNAAGFPSYYEAVSKWINDRERDSKSVLSCL